MWSNVKPLHQLRDFVREHPWTAVGAAAGASFLLGSAMFGGPQPLSIPVDKNQQSVPVKDVEGARCSAMVDWQNGEYFKTATGDYNNVYECFLEGEKTSKNGPCLGYRDNGEGDYKWYSYSETREMATAIGSAIIAKGFPAGQETYVGIYSQNRPEWTVTDIGCQAFRMIPVPLYDTLGQNSTKFIINLVPLSIVIVDTNAKVEKLIEQRQDIEPLKLIVTMETTIPETLAKDATTNDVELVTWDSMLELGRANLSEPQKGENKDLFTVCFTSGTTGDPKGVMLNQTNMLTHCVILVDAVVQGLSTEDRHLSYLPLPHQFERVICWITLRFGAQYGFSCGDTKKLLQDVAALKPTIFCGVPKIYTRIYDKVMGGVNSANFVKKSLFNMAYSYKKSEVERGIIRKDSWWDKLVFNKLQALLGGNVRIMVTAAAPISEEVIIFLRVVFGSMVVEGYGQTEGTAASCATHSGDTTTGHVGPPLPCCMIKLIDVPEKEYWAKDNKGEVCFKGSNVCQGYLKRPDLTAETIDKDGWLHSGDIGMWKPNGCLKIIDRKKHIFKLAQGEYVAPEKIEQMYLKCSLIAQIFCYGNSNQSQVVALVVPDEEELPKFASSKGWKGTFEEVCKKPEVKQAIMAQLDERAKTEKLFGFEKVRAICVMSELFSVERNLLTPTLKNKRPMFEKQFGAIFDSLYEEINTNRPK